jgi:hypothetical protein
MMIRRHVIAAAGGLVVATVGALAQTVSSARSNGTMEIKRSGSQPSRKGPAELVAELQRKHDRQVPAGRPRAPRPRPPKPVAAPADQKTAASPPRGREPRKPWHSGRWR